MTGPSSRVGSAVTVSLSELAQSAAMVPAETTWAVLLFRCVVWVLLSVPRCDARLLFLVFFVIVVDVVVVVVVVVRIIV